MRTAARKLLGWALPGLLLAALPVLPAQAAVVNIATSPLYNSGSTLVKPNLLFILDDSSSMDYNFLPDEVPRDVTLLGSPNPQTDSHVAALTSSQCSGVAYNPAFNYTVPLKSDGTSYANSTFGAAPVNGFDPNSVVVSLSGQFYYVYGNGGTQTALGYIYQDGAVYPNTFYQECSVTTVASPPPATLGKFTKVLATSLAAAGTGPGTRTNYANWFSYYRTRLLMMKTLAGQAFSAVGDTFRVGFSTIHDQQADNSATFLPIYDFNASLLGVTGEPSPPQKQQFFTKLYAISANSFAVPQQYTPTRGALAKAGRLYAGKFVTGNGSAADALRDPMQYSCQQNFTVMASDGYWNSSDDKTSFGPLQLDNATPVGDQDGVAGTPRPMFDALGNPNTLADVSMYYYQTDLRHPGNCTSGATGANLCPVDSTGAYAPNVPGNSTDDNIKPHMTTLTVGLGINGILGYSPSYNTDQTGDFHSLVTGTNNIVWPPTLTNMTPPYYDATVNRQVIQRVDDLWHAAVNGRGTYFNAKNPTTLAQGLKGALAGVANRLGYGNAGATSSLAPIQGNNFLYVASYTTGQWTGNLLRQSVDVGSGVVNPLNTANGDWCVENIAADALAGTPECLGQLEGQVSKSSDNRHIYFNKTGTLTSFTYANLPVAQQAYFDNTKLSQYPSPPAPPWTTVASGATLVNYLRGQSQYESQNSDGTANLYRVRVAKLGDIVDNQPLYVGAPFYQYADPGYTAWKTASARKNRQKTVFVGSNDGMLHAFNADTGVEMWAFVPTPAMPCMYLLADLYYGSSAATSTSPTCLNQTLIHHNYVNGRLTFSDVCLQNCSNSSADWHTILFGALNGGGRGIYAIDITDPANPGKVWEFTSLNDADFGYSFGNPLAAKKSDGTWVVLVSSGIDNVKLNNGDPYDADGTGKGFLFVLDPNTGAVINPNGKYGTGVGSKAIGAAAANPSGLGRLAFWADSPEQDATALNVYGGDLFGNLWRFDINKAATTDPTAVIQLTTFKDPNGATQPVTTRPEMTLVSGHRMIFTATGKYLEVSDLTNTQTQSLYAIPDINGTPTANPRTLAKRTLVNNVVNNMRIRTLTADAVDPASGWYLDFPDIGKDSQGNNVGSERNSVDMVLATGTLLVATNVPTNGICDAGGYSWLNFFDYATGEAVTGSGGTVAQFMTGNDLTTGLNVVWVGGVPEVIRTGNATPPTRVSGITFAGATAGVIGHRVGWREIFTP